MKYNFKKKISAVFVVAFAAVTLFLMPVSALEWNGTSGGGNNGGGVASNGDYAVSTANEAAGYRFSIVDYYGNTIKSVTTTDIYCSSYSRYSDAYNASKFTNKYKRGQGTVLCPAGFFIHPTVENLKKRGQGTVLCPAGFFIHPTVENLK